MTVPELKYASSWGVGMEESTIRGRTMEDSAGPEPGCTSPSGGLSGSSAAPSCRPQSPVFPERNLGWRLLLAEHQRADDEAIGGMRVPGVL